MIDDHDRRVAAFREKIIEEIRLYGVTRWRSSEEEQQWSGLGINTHAVQACRLQNDPEIEKEHDTTQYPVLHRWKPREKKAPQRRSEDGAAR